MLGREKCRLELHSRCLKTIRIKDLLFEAIPPVSPTLELNSALNNITAPGTMVKSCMNTKNLLI